MSDAQYQEDRFTVDVECSLHHYRTEIPNIIFEMKLDVYQIAVYAYLKKIAGDKGACWKTSQHLCDDIGISIPKLRDTKKILESKGLIKIEKRKNAAGGTTSDRITIRDIWALNMKKILEKNRGKSGNGGGETELQGGCNEISGGVKRRFTKEDPLQEDVVVVRARDAQDSSFEKTKPSIFSKDDLYFKANKTLQEWSVNEIEDAWKIFEKADASTISDPFAYISGIISKNRNKKIAETKKLIEYKQKGKSKCQQTTTSQQNILRGPNEKLNSGNETTSTSDTSEHILAKYNLLNGFKGPSQNG